MMEPAPYLSDEVLCCLPAFPLPSTVFFPGTELCLEMAESWQISLVRYCMQADRAMVVSLCESRGADSEEDPEMHAVAGAGRLVQAEEREGGRLRIVLWGTDRVRVLQEYSSSLPFRLVRCERLGEEYEGTCYLESERCLRALSLRVAGFLPDVKGQILQVLEHVDHGSGLLADQIACRLVPDPKSRQAILEELRVARRMELVTREVAEVCLRVDPTCRRGSTSIN